MWVTNCKVRWKYWYWHCNTIRNRPIGVGTGNTFTETIAICINNRLLFRSIVKNPDKVLRRTSNTERTHRPYRQLLKLRGSGDVSPPRFGGFRSAPHSPVIYGDQKFYFFQWERGEIALPQEIASRQGIGGRVSEGSNGAPTPLQKSWIFQHLSSDCHPKSLLARLFMCS